MKWNSSVLATAIVTIGFLASGAAEARVGWQGRGIYSAVNQTCIDDGQVVGFQLPNVSYFPAGLSDNGADSYLTFMSQRAVYSVKIAGGSFAAGKPYTAVKVNSYGRHDTNGVGQIVAFTTGAVTATTKFINMTIRITNYLETAGCTATFEVSLVRRLD